jgi:hypothetical protein
MVARVAMAMVAVAMLGCSASILKSKDIELTLGDADIRVSDETGAIIVGKRQVGSVEDNGKIVNSRGQLLAWVHGDSIRLPGGASVPIKTDAKGAVYLPESAQDEAGLEPIEHRVRPDGYLARSDKMRGIEVQGAHTETARRTILAIVLLTENDRW